MTTKQLTTQALAISEDLQKAVSATQTKTDSTVYHDHAEKAGLTKETIDGVKNYDRTFAGAALHAAATVGLAAHLADPKVEKIEFTFGGAKGEEFNAVYTPKKEGTIPANGDRPAKDFTSFGGVRMSHKSTASGKGGDIGVAIAMAAEAAELALTKSK